MEKAAVSIVIIAKNEEKRLAECLESALWASEIIVVDDQSTDRTAEIARRYTPHVYERAMDQEGRHRNYAYSLASQPWVFSLDADERITPELAAEIAETVKNTLPDYVCYSVPVKSFLGRRWLLGAGYYPARKTRLFRRGKFRYDEISKVHPRVFYEGSCGRLKHDLIHYFCEDMEHWFRKFNRETSLEAEKWFTEGRTPGSATVVRKAFSRFLKYYFGMGGWKSGYYGFLFSLYHSLYQLVSYAKYLEIAELREPRVSWAHELPKGQDERVTTTSGGGCP